MATFMCRSLVVWLAVILLAGASSESGSVSAQSRAKPTDNRTRGPEVRDDAYFLEGSVTIHADVDDGVWVTITTGDAKKVFLFQTNDVWRYESPMEIESSEVLVKQGEGIVITDPLSGEAFTFSVTNSFLDDNRFSHHPDLTVHPLRAYGFVEYSGFDGEAYQAIPKIHPCRVGGFPCDAGGPESNACSISGCAGIPHDCSVSGCDGAYSACCGCQDGVAGRACCLCVPTG